MTRPLALARRIVKALLPAIDWPAVGWLMRLMFAQRWLVLGLGAATIGGALSEGLGIAALVPLLDAINHNANAFASIPLMGHIADLFAGWSVADEIKLIAVILAALSVLRSGLSYLQTVLTQLVALAVDQKVKLKIVDAAQRLDFERLQRIGATTLLSYATTLALQSGFFCSLVATAFGSLVLLGLYVFVCLALSWQLTLIAGVALLAAVQFVRLPLLRRTLDTGRKRTATAVDMNRVLFSGFSGAKLLRLVAGEERHAAKIALGVERFMHNERRYNHLQSLVDPMFQAAIAVIVAGMLYASMVVLGNGAAGRIPLILLFLFVLNRVISPVQTLNRVRLGLAATHNAIETIYGFIAESRRHPAPESGRAFAGLRRKIALEHVGFRYMLDDGEAPAIEDVSFDIPARGMVALVGPSGAGKTTLIGLLTRLYRPQTGRITVDGLDLADVAPSDWRVRIAVVTQDTFLFDDTVAANLRLLRPDAGDAELEAAARRAEAHDFIAALPQGYQTAVGENGARLSGGQQQRLALARALLAKPDLLILDEATSNLDAETEHFVSKTLDALVKDCAVLVVAHRLATVQRADAIVVLDGGRVVETGTHDSLMRARGKYHGMVTRQMFAGDAPPEASAAQ